MNQNTNININNVKEWLCFGKNFLKNAEIESYSIDAEILLMKVLNFTKVELFTKDDYILSDNQIDYYKKLLKKRELFMPVQYITGKCEFMGLDFKLNSYTLIPRPDTEILVENAVNIIKENNLKSVIDIGTGSGSIAISIAKFCPGLKIIASDISEKALEIAKINAENNNVLNQIEFIKSDVFENINSKFDVIISNPPYIKSNIINTLIPQVKDYEPISALDGGYDGLFFYKKIISESKEYLNKNGRIFFEIGYDQSEDVSNILLKENFNNIEIIKDLSGLDRVILCKL